MVSDSIANSAVPNVRDLGKKKRANRSAKLKQCKLDVRREQWLAQVKKKGCGEEWIVDGLHRDGSNGSSETVETRREPGRPGSNGRASIHHDSYVELSPSNSPISLNSILGSDGSGTNYSASSSSSSSAGCCSGNITEEEYEGGDDGCLDDWEAIADALAANDERPKPPAFLTPHQEHAASNESVLGVAEENMRPVRVTPAAANTRAWRPDDASRPPSLPNLAKHYSFPNSSERIFVNGGIPWVGCNTKFSAPTSCPICCEDLDLTDSSFLPCLCGFRLCLFCHKRILEEDGRCPGCRKPYELNPVEAEASVQGGRPAFRLNRSSSLMERP